MMSVVRPAEAAPSGANAAITWRYALTNALMLAFLAALVAGGLYIWLVIGATLLIGTVADEAHGDERAQLAPEGRWFYEASLYATLPLIAAITLVDLHHLTARDPVGLVHALAELGVPFDAASWTVAGPIIAATIGTGIFYAVAAVTVGHELIHRSQSRLATATGRALLAFTGNSSFAVSHVHTHHRHVGTRKDSATARRGESAFRFAIRAVVEGPKEAFTHETERLRRMGLSAWSWRNRALSGQAYTLGFAIVAAAVAGAAGLAGFVAAAPIGRLFHESINYVQHFGLVREEGAPLAARHAWDCHRGLSNALQYNLPRHADHHLHAAKPFWQLAATSGAPLLPHGYQTMALIALVPPLWRRTIVPLLAEWDRSLASDAERRLIARHGWTIERAARST
jgi:fatty acid desaturase